MQQSKRDAHTIDQRKPVTAAKESLMLTLSRQWLINNPKKAVKYAAPAAGIVLAGPIVSLLPLGPFTPILSIIVTSFASSRLKKNAVGGAVAFLQAGGLRGFEGQLLALLSFMSFSCMFEKLGGPLQDIYSDFNVKMGVVQPALTGALLATFAELLGLSETMSHTLRTGCVNALILASSSFAASWSKKVSLDTLKATWRLFVRTMGEFKGANKVGDNSLGMELEAPSHASMGNESKFSSRNMDLEAASEQLLEDWEFFEDVDEDKTDGTDCDVEDVERRAQVLFDELNFLIDGCSGLESREWDEALATLDRQDDFEMGESDNYSLDA